MPIFEILLYLFGLIVLIQVFFYGVVFGNFTSKKIDRSFVKKAVYPISVLVCAKNEAENLKKNLPLFLAQDYPNFELVLINDGSTDATLKVMQRIQKEHEAIKIVNVKSVEAFWGNKKYALTLGIKASSHEHLLFTDADCKPSSNQWIKEMTGHFSNEKLIVIGYGAYQKIPKSFLNKLIRFETLLTALQYFSYAKLGQPYMGVGRNLAYTKSLFFSANGFISHMNIKSGDDDLFVNEVATSSNTALCSSDAGFTESVPKKTYADWILQKRRHVSTASFYKTKHKVMLALFYISQILFLILAIVLISSLQFWQIVVGLIVMRYLVAYISLATAMKKLKESDLIVFIPLLELFLIVSQFSIFIKNLTSKPTHWK